MNIKGFVRSAIRTSIVTVLKWAYDGEAEVEVEENHDEVERDAAYLVTGLITATRAINEAHQNGVRCDPHHEAVQSLLESVEDQMTAVLVIQHLLQIAAQVVSAEDLQNMVATIVATELDEDDDDHL